MIFKNIGLVVGLSVVAIMITLNGCSAMRTAIKKSDLDVQTKMSETVFLEPVAADEKIVYVDIRNTSDKEMNINEKVMAAFINKGYKITKNPKEATYTLQANILKVGKSDLREVRNMNESSFGSTITGGLIGVGASRSLGGDGRSSAAVGLAGAAIGFIGDALVEDIVYVMVTDLQIRERPLSGETITQTQQANLTQGSSTKVRQNIKGASVKWKTYRMRVVSTANKMNLEFEEAKQMLEEGLTRSISGIF